MKTQILNRHSHPRTSRIAKNALALIFCATLAACGGNKKAPIDAETGEPTADITRPPQTIVGRIEVQERNPEETISFDEWRKRRLEEQRQQQSPE